MEMKDYLLIAALVVSLSAFLLSLYSFHRKMDDDRRVLRSSLNDVIAKTAYASASGDAIGGSGMSGGMVEQRANDSSG